MFAFLEDYSGGTRSKHAKGFLIPYVALATFAGIRPAVDHGELKKIHDLADKSGVIDLQLGVVRIEPAIAKTNDLRQVTIQPNLRAWLEKYPVDKFPLIVPGMEGHLSVIREKFGLGNDVLRHSFISYHAGKFRSLGDSALQAGNSERIVKKHYYNAVTEGEAEAFWSVAPRPPV